MAKAERQMDCGGCFGERQSFDICDSVTLCGCTRVLCGMCLLACSSVFVGPERLDVEVEMLDYSTTVKMAECVTLPQRMVVSQSVDVILARRTIVVECLCVCVFIKILA